MIIDQQGRRILNIKYNQESDLQKIIDQHPELLNHANTLYSIGREINTGAGPVDVLMVSDKGEIVVVEVKLGKNGDIRRKVVAQIIDYISTFTQYSYHELDRIVKNELSRIVDERENASELPKIIDENLRHGEVNLIIAVDEANKDLKRIVDFLARYSDFKIFLVEIKQLKNLDGSVFYSSNTLVEPREDSHAERGTNYILENVCEQWNNRHPNLLVHGSGARFRQIRIPKWPMAVHYEFFFNEGGKHFDVRLDNELPLEDPLCQKVSEKLIKFNGVKIEDKYIVEAKINQTTEKTMRLLVRVDIENVDNSVIVMEGLLEATQGELDEVLLRK